jgi:preprotein translocase subunit SecF
MYDYRSEMKEVRWTFWRILVLVVVAVVVLSALGFGLNSLGVFGSTVVERKVFEQSYQRQEALKSRIAIDEATLAEINAKLQNPKLDENTRYNLKAQATAARIRIQTAKRKLSQ